MKIDQPPFHLVGFKRSFQCRAATVWNNIPLKIREKPSIESFKKALTESNVLNQINFGHNSTARARDPNNFIYF